MAHNSPKPNVTFGGSGGMIESTATETGVALYHVFSRPSLI